MNDYVTWTVLPIVIPVTMVVVFLLCILCAVLLVRKLQATQALAVASQGALYQNTLVAATSETGQTVYYVHQSGAVILPENIQPNPVSTSQSGPSFHLQAVPGDNPAASSTSTTRNCDENSPPPPYYKVVASQNQTR